MKKFIILLLTLTSIGTHALDEKSIIKCNGSSCVKEFKVIENNKNNVEIKLEEIIVGICLVDFENQDTFKVIEADYKSKKVVMLQEVDDGDLSILKRVLTFYDDKSFNRQLRILPCEQTDTKILLDEEKTKLCLKTASKYAQKYFCEKERLKNF